MIRAAPFIAWVAGWAAHAMPITMCPTDASQRRHNNQLGSIHSPIVINAAGVGCTQSGYAGRIWAVCHAAAWACLLLGWGGRGQGACCCAASLTLGSKGHWIAGRRAIAVVVDALVTRSAPHDGTGQVPTNGGLLATRTYGAVWNGVGGLRNRLAGRIAGSAAGQYSECTRQGQVYWPGQGDRGLAMGLTSNLLRIVSHPCSS